ncbi:TetR/AcrR family transcriptional regulator [Allobranchiibius sp. GilTou73]|uniref:TetR/AcrR family transcriptional regulator n=1 Tax=Allobranchiibius sp. GilTou73 TaxID=2904523 RepID=UPI001F163AB3|nr:TetR/AcrR family transcriptional regulator [Allobranchiibius sp. GilTou73]UIJ36379.1 TetR/AcrR family transcriptional regulator [Allobranchiibius sp. GilTou73]
MPRTARRGRPGYDLDSLLAVAVEVFNERGYDATSMGDLSDRLGIAKSAIYHHVASKEVLLRLALDRALDGLEAVTQGARELDVSAVRRLEHLVHESVVLLLDHQPYVTLLLRVRGNSPVELAALQRRRALDRYAASLVRDAVREGDLRADLDPTVTARLIFGLVNSLVEWTHPASRQHTQALPEVVGALVFDGLLVRD